VTGRVVFAVVGSRVDQFPVSLAEGAASSPQLTAAPCSALSCSPLRSLTARACCNLPQCLGASTTHCLPLSNVLAATAVTAVWVSMCMQRCWLSAESHLPLLAMVCMLLQGQQQATLLVCVCTSMRCALQSMQACISHGMPTADGRCWGRSAAVDCARCMVSAAPPSDHNTSACQGSQGVGHNSRQATSRTSPGVGAVSCSLCSACSVWPPVRPDACAPPVHMWCAPCTRSLIWDGSDDGVKYCSRQGLLGSR
jgi:hypothetical protein